MLTLEWTNFVHFGGAGLLTKSSISAIRALIYLGYSKTELPLSALAVARQLRESPSYLSKILRRMVRYGLLEVVHGASGGFRLSRRPDRINLFEIVEACQGVVTGDACPREDLALACGFHQASVELRDAVTEVLSRWTLADCMGRPAKCSGRDARVCRASVTLPSQSTRKSRRMA